MNRFWGDAADLLVSVWVLRNSATEMNPSITPAIDVEVVRETEGDITFVPTIEQL